MSCHLRDRSHLRKWVWSREGWWGQDSRPRVLPIPPVEAQEGQAHHTASRAVSADKHRALGQDLHGHTPASDSLWYLECYSNLAKSYWFCLGRSIIPVHFPPFWGPGQDARQAKKGGNNLRNWNTEKGMDQVNREMGNKHWHDMIKITGDPLFRALHRKIFGHRFVFSIPP